MVLRLSALTTSDFAWRVSMWVVAVRRSRLVTWATASRSNLSTKTPSARSTRCSSSVRRS